MSSSFDKSQDSQPKKRYTDFCSTPVLKDARKLSISESTVDTHSSSSAKGTNIHVLGKTKERKKKTKKRRVRKGKTKDEAKKDSESDWETTHVYSETLSHVVDSDNDVLFKDVKSPERIRDAPRLVTDFLESPTLRSTRLLVESPERIVFDEKDAFPSKELPLVNVSLDDTDDEEEASFLRRKDVVRTYLGIRNEKRSKKAISIDKTKQWLVNVSVPTTSSDLLWDNFVKNNYENVGKYLATSPNSKQKSSTSIRSKEKVVGFKNSTSITNKECNYEEKNAKAHDFGLRIPKNMNVVRGRYDKSLQKWVRTDEYTFLQQEDVEFKTNSEKKPKMGLNEFLRKCKAEKQKIKELSPLKSEESSTAEDSCETRNELEGFVECVESSFKRRKISDSELERINNIRKFASRLNAKEKLISNEMSLDKTTVPAASSSASTLKRVVEPDVGNAETIGKRRRISTKNKPTVKTVKLLTTVRYNKNKERWENI